jgi:hypothetical protein
MILLLVEGRVQRLSPTNEEEQEQPEGVVSKEQPNSVPLRTDIRSSSIVWLCFVLLTAAQKRDTRLLIGALLSDPPCGSRELAAPGLLFSSCAYRGTFCTE